MKKASSCIIPMRIQMEVKNIAAIESTGTSSRIKEQCEKQEKFVRTLSFFLKKEFVLRKKNGGENKEGKLN